MIGNVYYVGSRGLASYLITTPAGHILINSNLKTSVPLIRESIDDDIHSALLERGTGPQRRRSLPKPVRRAPRPRDFGPRRRR